MLPELTLVLVVIILLSNNIILMKKVNELINKLMSRDYQDYTRAKILETQVKAELENIKDNAPETERF